MCNKYPDVVQDTHEGVWYSLRDASHPVLLKLSFQMSYLIHQLLLYYTKFKYKILQLIEEHGSKQV